jgi:glucosamine kinase
MRCADEGNSSNLLDAILRNWKLQNHEQLILKSNSIPLPDFATLMPVVQQCADAGDWQAKELLERAGSELAAIGNIVIGRLFDYSAAVPVAMSGGVFEHSPPVRQSFYNHLRKPVSLASGIVQPVKGALEIARRG